MSLHLMPMRFRHFFDAMSSIKVKNVTTERSSDCDDIFYFTFADASAYRISFNGHHLEANGLAMRFPVMKNLEAGKCTFEKWR